MAGTGQRAWPFRNELLSTKPGANQVSATLLTDLTQKSAIYALLLKPESIADSFIQDHCKVLHRLSDSYRILMLDVLDENIRLTLSERRELARYCEVLSVRWVLTGGNAQELEDHFQLICQELKNPEKSYSDVKETLLVKMPADSRVRAQFSIDTSKTALVRVVLHRINKLIGDVDEMLILDPSKMHVEHIAPATATEHWKNILFPGQQGDVNAEYSVRVELWGNKTLLDEEKSTSR